MSLVPGHGAILPFQLSLVPPAGAVAPLPQALGTLGRKEVDEDGHRGDEYTGRDDVDDVEEGLALDEQVEDDLLVAGLLGWCRLIQQHLGWPVPDGPLSIFCRQQAGVGTGSAGGQIPAARVTQLQGNQHVPKGAPLRDGNSVGRWMLDPPPTNTGVIIMGKIRGLPGL